MTGFPHLADLTIHDIAGIMGFCTYVLAYSLLTTHRLTSAHIRYFCLNLCASSLVLFSLIGAFNLATMLIQVFFVGTSIVAILVRLRTRRKESDVPSGVVIPHQQAVTEPNTLSAIRAA